MTRRLSTKIEQWVESALEVHSELDERVEFDLSFGEHKDGNPWVQITFFMPGKIENTLVQTTVYLGNVTQAGQIDIECSIINCLSDLRYSQMTQSESSERLPLTLIQGEG